MSSRSKSGGTAPDILGFDAPSAPAAQGGSLSARLPESGTERAENSPLAQKIVSPLRSKPILPGIIHPSQVAELSLPELEQLAAEIRATLVETVSHTGGHLAPSLGVVELTLAMLSVFNPAKDKLVWDVGHQSYAYKLLTGRRDKFHSLRQLGGISGFPNRRESPFDHFGVGHSSTSISAALGMAVARDVAEEDYHVVSVIGDGSLTAGLAYEGLNQAGAIAKRFIVILNDNEMSISKNVGALSLFMSRNLSSRWVRKVKREVENLLTGIPGIGDDLLEIARRSKYSFKNFFTPGMLFEALRFNYIGAVDGHNIEELQKALHLAAAQDRPVLLHVLTRKGKGYRPAEDNPVRFHGVGRFEPEDDALRPAWEKWGGAAPVVPADSAKNGVDGSAVFLPKKKSTGSLTLLSSSPMTYTQAFGAGICALAERDPRIVAITAAMPEGTGLQAFSERFPDRFFDVGICEQHAVTFAAGLAVQGLRPFVCIYSTFMQRAYDQIVHDVCLQELPVVFCLDRAGLVGEDGATHQGAFDLAFLRHIPNMTLFVPGDEAELQRGLVTGLALNRPFALRYPRGAGEGAALPEALWREHPFAVGKGEFLRHGNSGLAVLAVGNRVGPALAAAREAEALGGQSVTVFNARWVKPLPEEDLKKIAQTHDKLLVLEESSLAGGFSSAVLEFLSDNSLLGSISVSRMGLPDAFVEHGASDSLRERLGIDTAGIVARIRMLL